LSDKKETNREIVARLFNKRTGVVYQNWIQAWSVTEKQKKKKRTIYVYSSDDCRVDKTGGPYKVKIDDFKVNR